MRCVVVRPCPLLVYSGVSQRRSGLFFLQFCRKSQRNSCIHRSCVDRRCKAYIQRELFDTKPRHTCPRTPPPDTMWSMLRKYPTTRPLAPQFPRCTMRNQCHPHTPPAFLNSEGDERVTNCTARQIIEASEAYLHSLRANGSAQSSGDQSCTILEFPGFISRL
jgi:hypothetical protein